MTSWRETLSAPAAPGYVRLRFNSLNRQGDETEKVLRVSLAEPGDATARLAVVGLTLADLGPDVQVRDARFGGMARKIGLDIGDKLIAVETQAQRISRYVMFVPALLVLALIFMLQRGRKRRLAQSPAAA